MNKERIIILLVGLCCPAIRRGSVANAEYWSEFELKRTLIGNSFFEVKSQLRVEAGISEIYQLETEVGPTMKITRFMEVGMYYKDKEEKGERGWHTTRDVCLYESFLAGFAGIQFSDRNRFDYEDFERFKYRNKLEIKMPFTIYEATMYYGQYPTIWRVIPAIEEEVFYNFEKNKVDESRFLGGISFELLRRLDFRIGGLLHSERSNTSEKWENKGALVTTIQFIFLE